MATCSNCHTVCDDTARFCPNCATPLVPQAPQQPQQAFQPAPQQPPQAPQGYPPQQPAYGAPAQAGYAPSPGFGAPNAAPQPGGNVVQPVAPAPFSGAPVQPSPRPAAMPQPRPGVPTGGAVGAPSPAAVPAGFGLQAPGAQGAPVPPAFAPAPPVLPKKRGASPLRFIPFLLGPIITIGVLGFMFIGGGSCSSVEGQFQSAGEPVGTFTFVPKQCRSGERMNVHGAILVGEGPTDGGVMVIQDPVKGPIVKVELPGSCQPPDYEICTEVTIDKSECSVFKVKIRRTNTTVNDIRLMDGSLELDCSFKEGGTVKAKLDFENCD